MTDKTMTQIGLIVRDVCESDRPDYDGENVVVIDIADLRAILTRHLSQPAEHTHEWRLREGSGAPTDECECGAVRDSKSHVRIADSQPAEHGEAVAPFGYAFRYPDGIRFNTGGREINGCKPSETIPLYTSPPPAAGVPDGFDIERAKALMGYVIGYCKATELRSLSSDAMQALKELDTMLSATPSPTIDVAAVRGRVANAIDNLRDFPVNEDWATRWSEKAEQLLAIGDAK